MLDTSSMLSVYDPYPVEFTRGYGSTLYDAEGKKYIDFAAGVATNSLGYGNQELIRTLKEAADKIWHISNLYTIKPAIDLADTLVQKTFADKAFFVSSGTEAVECAIKLARAFYRVLHNQTNKYEIITFYHAFHGRTMGAISATSSDKHIDAFKPYLPGFKNIPMDHNIDTIAAAIDENTAAIMLEPIQGEGGINIFSTKLLQDIRQLCNERDILMIADEIQSGAGRTGKFLAIEHANVTPDICTIAKGIGNGMPIGGCLTTNRVAKCFKPGMHGSTYGGNPLATTVCKKVIETITEPAFLQNVVYMGQYLMQKLLSLQATHSNHITEIRGVGMLIGIQLGSHINNKELVVKLRGAGLLTVKTALPDTIRVTPPLTITKEEIDEGIAIFHKILQSL